ncbi:MAG: hypothetical protein Q4G43_03095 [Mobilicoccus sp.]|nr:hypothetical protein [Mobilicoccus sp.]
MSDDEGTRHPGRRAFLTAAALTVAGGAAWMNADRLTAAFEDTVDRAREQLEEPRAPRAAPTPVPAGSLPVYDDLAGARLYYEASGDPASFRMQEAFANRLSACLTSHWQATRWGVPGQLWSYGTWVDEDSRPRASWHHEGRAFDLTRVRTVGGDELVSCRYDRWSETTGSERADHERAYWRLAASLHRDFAFVLTYLYDTAHHDHIHVDDGRSGDGPSRFDRSRTQVQAIQAMCTHVWGIETPVTGAWDEPVRSATSEIMRRIGAGQRLSRTEHWHAFCSATAAQG